MKESTKIARIERRESEQRNTNKGLRFDGPFAKELIDIIPGALFEISKIGEVYVSIPGINTPFRGNTVEAASQTALLFLEKKK
ncbi:MAG: hypothetical protein WAN61_04030 [Minisyncoccia bacterium]